MSDAESPGTAGVPWRDFFAEAQQRLARVPGLAEGAAIDARRIVEEAGGFEPSEFVAALDDMATVRGVRRFDSMLSRRLAGEPLQYVVGRWGFRTLDLAVDARALIPRPETESVVSVALDELDRQAQTAESPHRVVDLGTGSGAIALSIAVERPNVLVYGTDRSAEALALARANLTGIGRAATRVRLLTGSWFDALPPELHGSFNVVVSNPPYVRITDELPPVVREWEPAEALFAGTDGLDAYRSILADASIWLQPDGAVVLEIGADQGADVAELADRAGFGDISILPDLVGRDRTVLCRR